MPGFGPVRDLNMVGDFIKFLANNFLPQIPPKLQEKDSLTIAVVTHWETVSKLETVLCGKKDELKHSEVLDVEFVYKAHAVVATSATYPPGEFVRGMPLNPYLKSAKLAWEAMKDLP